MTPYDPIKLPYVGLITLLLVGASIGRIGPKVNAISFDATEERIDVHFAVTEIDDELREDVEEIVDELGEGFGTFPDLKAPPIEAKIHIGSALEPWPGKMFSHVYWSKTDYTSGD